MSNRLIFPSSVLLLTTLALGCGMLGEEEEASTSDAPPPPPPAARAEAQARTAARVAAAQAAAEAAAEAAEAAEEDAVALAAEKSISVTVTMSAAAEKLPRSKWVTQATTRLNGIASGDGYTSVKDISLGTVVCNDSGCSARATGTAYEPAE